MNVVQRAIQEERWLSKQRRLIGNRDALYEKQGIYAAWRDLFRQYVTLAQEGEVEALKRALYFIWAERAIGPLSTGIRELDEDLVRKVFDLAEKQAQDNRLDPELEWMLPYYYLVERSYLDGFGSYEALKQASNRRPLLYRECCLEVSFDQRGQMGDYWKTEQTHLRRWG
ncbi:MAG: hypothetical protein MUC88_04290 [Planctomycetes bacterium]|nr:hypothetical protein [Planctomycetota bacterium]